MRRSNKKAAILATVLGGWMLSGSSVLAANLMAGVPSDYVNSQLGAITGSYVTTYVDAAPSKGVVTDLNRDPAVFNVMVNGESKLFLRQYTYSTTSLKNSVLFDSDGDWSSVDNPSGAITKAPNAHGAAASGDYLYITDYDLGYIGVAKITKTGLIEDTSKAIDLKASIINDCKGVLDNPYAWVHGEGIIAKDGYLYVMVNVNPEGSYYKYEDSYLIQYKVNIDGSLAYMSHTRAGKNTDAAHMNVYNNMILTTAIGGMQNYGGTVSDDKDSLVAGEGGTKGNKDTCINIGVVSGGKLDINSQKVVVPEKVKERGLDFRDMQILPNGTAYIMTYNLSGSGGGSAMRVYKTTVTNLLSSNPQDWEEIIAEIVTGSETDQNGSGWFNKIFAEYYTKRVWAEIGDSLVVYTDGDSAPKYTWLTKDFSTNEQLYKWNSLIAINSDEVAGNTALLVTNTPEGITSSSVTTLSTINANATNKTGDYNYGITGTEADTVYSAVSKDNSIYTFDSDKVINLNVIRRGDTSNNVLAAIYANDGNDITIEVGDNILQLQAKNYVSTPVGVFAGNGKNVTINSGTLNIVTAGYIGGNTLTNAIWLDPTKQGEGSIAINSDINISMSGGYGGNGIAIQKTDRWGEASYSADNEAAIVINGDVTIKGADSETWGIPVNYENVFSRFNNAGILTSVEKSNVTVNGDVDFDVYGNGVTTNAKDSVVTINGGGKITVPSGMNYGYYTLASFLGTINMNTGANGNVLGSNDVQLNGDIFALNTGNINLALTTEASYLDGIVDNGGTVNLWLQNGATWINEANNTRYKQDNEDVGSGEQSRVTNFVGGNSKASAGVIHQTTNSKDLTIDNYSGYTKVLYGHDDSNPTNIYGGNVTIGSASNGSNITLITNYDANMNSTDVQNEVLNALANKLYYIGYTNGENNLTGTVAIAEGLTASSVYQYVGDIAYSSSTGQGRLDGTGKPAPVEPDRPTLDEDGAVVYKSAETWESNTSGDNVQVEIKDDSTWKGDSKGDNLTANITNSTWEGNSTGAGLGANIINSTWKGDSTGDDAEVTLSNGANWTGVNSGNDATINVDGASWIGANTGDKTQINMSGNASWGNDNEGSNATVVMESGTWNGNNNGENANVNISGKSSWIGNNLASNAIVDGDIDGLWQGDNAGTVTVDGITWNGDNLTNATAIVGSGVWDGNNFGTATFNGGNWNGDNKEPGKVTVTADGWSGNNAGTVTLNKGTWDGTNSGTVDMFNGTWGGNNSDTGIVTLNGGTWSGDNEGTATIKGGTWTNNNAGIVTFNGGSWNGDNTANGEVTIESDGWIGNNEGAVSLNNGTWDGTNYGIVAMNSGTWGGKNSSTATVNGGTWSGNNEAQGNATIADGTWSGTNAGDATIIGGEWANDNTGIVNFKGGSWTGDNTETGKVTVTADGWTGNNTGAGTVIVKGATWGGNNLGTGATLNFNEEANWTGDNTGANATVKLDGASNWNGANTGANLNLTLDGASEWTGYSNVEGFTINLNGNSVWKNTGASKVASFVGNNGVVDMSSANSGNITIDNYSGNVTVLYDHNVLDAAGTQVTVNGGNFTVTSAMDNSAITLVMGRDCLDLTEEDSINAALNALAAKLFYTNYKDEGNLAGTVKIAEGLTASSVSKQVASIVFSGEDGQGSVDKSTINPGPQYPTVQDKDTFTTVITGDAYDSDAQKEYRKFGVIQKDAANTYNFTHSETTITTDESTINTLGNVVLNLNGNALKLVSGNEVPAIMANDNITINGVGVLEANNGIKVVKDKTATINLNGKESELKADVLAGEGVVEVDLGYGTWIGGNAGNVVAYAGSWIGDNSNVVNFRGGDWTGNNSGIATLHEVTWTGDNTGTANFEYGSWHGDNHGTVILDGNEWQGCNIGTVTFNKGEWTGTNSGEATIVNGTWNGDNSGTVSFNGGSWTGDNTENGTVTVNATGWTGNNTGDAILKGGTWTGTNSGIVTLNNGTWSGNNFDAGNVTLNGGEWTGDNTGESATVSGKNGKWTGDNSGTITVNGITWEGNNLEGVTLSSGTWSGTNSGTATIEGGTWSNDNAGTVTFNGGSWNGNNAANGEVTIEADGWSGNNAGSVSLNNGIWDGTNSGTVNMLNGTWGGNNSDAGIVTLNGGTWNGDNEGTATINDGTWSNDNAGTVTFNGGSWTGDNTENGEVTIEADGWSGNNAGSVSLNNGTWDGTNSGTVVMNNGTWGGENAGTATFNGGTWNGSNEAQGNATIASGTWSGTNAGNATITGGEWTNDNTGTVKFNGGEWTGDNAETGKVTVTAEGWIGNNTGAGTVIVKGATWGGNNLGAGATLTFNEKASWTGDNSGADATVKLDGASNWNGTNTGANLNLTLDGASVWTGYSNADDFTLNLNGNSVWKNTGASKVASFVGNNGVVDMSAVDSGNITIDGYSGNVTVLYDHSVADEAGTQVTVNGGNFTVTSATENSAITLVMGRDGLDLTEEDSINVALNALAAKLFYTNYAEEGNLAGTVKIAEGLTASSVSKQTASIIFGGEDGQGSVDKSTINPGAQYPTEQDKESFETAITGDAYDSDAQKEYRKHGVIQKDNAVTYSFIKDKTTLTTTGSAINTVNDVVINLNGNDLEVNASEAAAVKANDNITVNEIGILTVTGGIEVSAGEEVKAILKGESSEFKAEVLEGEGIVKVELNKGNWTGVNKGQAEATNGNWTGANKGTVTLSEVTWTGDNAGVANINGSTWSGNNFGNGVNLNDSVWTGYSNAEGLALAINNSTWNNTGTSNVQSVTANNGVVNMTNANSSDVTIANYSGSMVVLYNHSIADDATSTMTGGKVVTVNGGNITIGSAATGAEITLRTDRNGLNLESSIYTDKNLVNAALDALANKLFYTAYTTGETNLKGYVEIAEGLTASSVSKRVEGVSFDEVTGQGGYVYETAYPEEQVKDTFELENALGSAEAEEALREAGVLKEDGKYEFTSDPTVMNGENVVIADGKDVTITAEGALELCAGNIAIGAANNKVDVEAKDLGIKGNVIAIGGGVVDVNATGKLVLDGDIQVDSNSVVTAKFSGADSKFIGNIAQYDDVTLLNSGFSENGVSLEFTNKASWEGWNTSDNFQISLDDSVWHNTDASKAQSITAKKGVVYMDGANAAMDVVNFSGDLTVVYDRDDEGNILGEAFVLKQASKVNENTNSSITLFTEKGNIEVKKDNEAEIRNVFEQLADKLQYKDYSANKGEDEQGNPINKYLDGYVKIAEGITGTGATADIVFGEDNTVGEIKIGPEINYGAYETAMMKGAKSAMTSSAMMWRAEANDLMKRMGDLRMAEGEYGIWAKYYGTKQEMEAQNTKYTNSYKAYQLGFDKKVGDWTVGVAASYGDGESTYASGRGENSVVSLGLYGAWNGEDGQYVDVIMKRSKLDNEYELNGDVTIGRLEADYETWATSISTEYGKRIETNKGFYVEPSVEFTLGRVDGASYNTSFSLGGQRLNVQQDDYDTLIGRLGLRLGQKLDKASYYAKFAVAKEFCGDYDTKYATLATSGLTDIKETSMSFKDTWYELQIGGTAQLRDNSYIYASYERNFGADVEQKWRIDAGLRWTF